MNGNKLQSVKTNSLKDRVYQTLLDAIFAGDLLPGDSIREMHLARDLEISQASVREALLKLEHVGLVIRIPNKGTIITILSNREISERLALRVMLEEVAGAEAVRHITPVSLLELKKRLNDISRAVLRNSHFEAAQADLEFHRCIWEMADNKTLYQTLDQITVPLFAFISILRRRERESLDGMVTDHEVIIDAFESEDPERVKTVLRQHIGRIYNDFLNSGMGNLSALAHGTAVKV